MAYRSIECPVCGNTITANSSPEAQKCKWCMRWFKVKTHKRKNKFIWEAEAEEYYFRSYRGYGY